VAVLATAAVLGWALQRGGGTGRLWGVAQAASAAVAASAASAPVPLAFQPHELLRPQRLALARTLELSGPLVAPDTVVLRAKAGGTLLDLRLQEGDTVRAGQVLARVDVADQAGRLAERQAALAAAVAAQQQAVQAHGSNERLAQQQFISAQALANSQATLDGARAQADQARAALAVAQAAAGEAMLRAPMAGVVARRHALPGEKVAPEQPVLTLVNGARLELAASVATHEVVALAPGLPVQVQVEGLATPLAGTLARIAPAAEPGSRSIAVAVAVPNPSGRLRAGSYAVARLVLPAAPPAAGAAPPLTLPTTAVSGSTGAPVVWLLEAGRLQRRSVTLGTPDEASGRVPVLTGLADTSLVLAQRFDNLRDGAPAVLASAPAPSAPAR
jgi:RND family efflux transporter MFP subunit